MIKSTGIVGFFSALLTYQVYAADINAAKTLVQKGNDKGAIACQTCHVSDGSGNPAAGYPRLSDISAEHLAKQLHDFKNGTRKDDVMQPIAKALSDTEILNVSAYFEKQKPTVSLVISDKDLVKRGERIATSGLWDKNIPPCMSCHGAAGHGIGSHFPPLAGQHAKYIENQIKAWRRGTRTNDPQGLMEGISRRLPEEAIAAVAAYFESLAKNK